MVGRNYIFTDVQFVLAKDESEANIIGNPLRS
jgi:hypothetical protein